MRNVSIDDFSARKWLEPKREEVKERRGEMDRKDIPITTTKIHQTQGSKSVYDLDASVGACCEALAEELGSRLPAAMAMKRPAASTSGSNKKAKGPSVAKQCKEGLGAFLGQE